MKNLSIIVIIMFQGISVYSQNNNLYEYKIQYDMQLNFLTLCTYRANLYFNNTQSLFEYKEAPFDEKEITAEEINNKLDQNNNISFDIRLKDTVLYYLKYDRNDNLIREFVRGFMSNEFYYVIELAPQINWTISEEQRRIDQYDCTKATCCFRGRNYIAWFTTSIQTSFGPLKLHGLPGLIVELTDEKKEIMIQARIVKKEEHLVKNDPLDVKTITHSEYKKLSADGIKKVEEIVNQIVSKSGRGFKTTANVKIGKTIELE